MAALQIGSVFGHRARRSAVGVSSPLAPQGRVAQCLNARDGNTIPKHTPRRGPKSTMAPIQVPQSRILSPGEAGKDVSPPPYTQPRDNAPEPSPELWEQEELEEYSNLDLEKEIPSNRYTQCIELSLEECFRGKRVEFHFTRKYASGKTSREILGAVLPPGVQNHTVLAFEDVGHEIARGIFQHINLIFVEKPHPLCFKRNEGNLSVLVSLPWTDRLYKSACSFSVTGVDGKKYSLEVDYPRSKMTSGRATFMGAGMPLLDRKKRGKLTIEWVPLLSSDE